MDFAAGFATVVLVVVAFVVGVAVVAHRRGGLRLELWWGRNGDRPDHGPDPPPPRAG